MKYSIKHIYLFLILVLISVMSCEKTSELTCSENPDCSTIDLVNVKALDAVTNGNNVVVTACLEVCIDSLEYRGVIMSISPISETSNFISNGNYSFNDPGSPLYLATEDLSNVNVESGEFTMSFSSLSNSTTFYYRAFTKYKESGSNNISDFKVSEEKEFTTN